MTQEQLLMERPTLGELPTAPSFANGYALRTAEGDADEAGLGRTLTAAFVEVWDVGRVQSALTATPDVLAVHVTTFEDAVVATASCLVVPGDPPGTGWVHWVGADPAHAGRGLGSALVIRVLEDFRERGFARTRLSTDDARIPAIRSYLRCGFVPVYAVGAEDHRERWSSVLQGVFAAR